MVSVVAGAEGMLSYGVTRLLAGMVFSLGLILVVVGGAELFTGNALIIMACASRRVSSALLVRNWTIVYLGNFVGSVATAALVFGAHHFLAGHGAVGAAALATANAKCQIPFVAAVCSGTLCNALVCMAVWLCFSARSTTDRILAIIPPITAFVAAGFEHSVANMYFIPMGLLIKAGAPEKFWSDIGKTPADFPALTLQNFLVTNLVPVTIGNIIGGALLVGVVYWFAYSRKRK